MSYYYPQAAVRLRVRWQDDTFTKNRNRVENYDVVARRVSVKINEYTKADTFRCEFDYKNFPFDPRAIRGLGVSIYIQDTGAIFKENNKLKSIVPSEDNVIFQGFADEESIDFDDMNRVIKVEGRDQTSLLIDSHFVYKEPTNLASSDIGTIFNNFLKDVTEFRIISVENRTGEELPIIASFAPGWTPFGNTKNKKKNETYWDVIQDLVQRAGLIAFIEIDKLVLTKPRNLYKIDESKKYPFIYGKNLRKLMYKRKLGRNKGFNVSVKSYNFEEKKLEVARIPFDAEDSWLREMKLPKANLKVDRPITTTEDDIKEEDKKDAPFISFRIPDIGTKAQLVKIGQSIFEEIGRQQIEGRFETKEMCVRTTIEKQGQSQGIEFDILKIRNGTPIKIAIEQGDMKNLEQQKTKPQKKKYLIDQCYAPQVAEAMAESLSSHSLTDTFYTKSVEFVIDQEDGFKMNLSFVNFINLGSIKVG